jgi:hypothetical protein
VNSVESALSCSVREVRSASEDWAGAAGVGAATVGTTTSALAGVSFLAAFLAGALAAGAGAGVAAGAAAVFADFLSAGIVFDLTAEVEAGISNALVYSLPVAVM